MKKILILLLAGLVLASCNNASEVSSSIAPTSETSITSREFTNVSFNNKIVIYNGQQHILDEVSGAPENTTITYSGRQLYKDVGIYEATATLSKEGYVTKTLTATLTINPADFANLKFADLTIPYDGKEHTLICYGVPSYATAVYENNKGKDVGEYHATATISAPNYNTVTLHATLKIETADITGVSFSNQIFTYDGNEHSIKVSGTIPSGVNVEYLNNKRTNAGSQQATAILSGYGYREKTLYATITINPANFTGISFADSTITYDGESHSIYCSNVPSFASVEYQNNGQTAVGTYQVKAIISAPNYNTLELTATLKIEARKITGITFEDASFVYDGNEHSISIKGSVPEGVSVQYENNKRTAVGSQEATATLSGVGYETLVLKATLTIEAKKITSVTFEDADYDYDGNEHEILVSGTILVKVMKLLS